MPSIFDRLSDTQAMKFIDQVGDIFKSLPKLPDSILEFIAKVVPYLALLGAILSIIAGPFLTLLGTLGSLLTLNPVLFFSTLVGVAALIAQAVLLFKAFKPLQDREMLGWIYLFWAELLAAVTGILTSLTSPASVVWNIVWTLFWLYVVFQLRPLYADKK